MVVKLCTTRVKGHNFIICHHLTDPILADVVSRQFKAAYWLITTNSIHMSWSEILPSLVILSLFTFEQHVIEIFLPNSVLMLYIRRWTSWCHVSSERNFGWLRPKLYSWMGLSWQKIQLSQKLGNYVPLTLYVEILFWANALRTPYWL